MQIPQHYHVAAGSYYVSRTKPLILQSFLGTCVGVALFDEEAQVGGLIHLLLPEPVSRAASIQPEKYASTGFPLFLAAICNEGASKSRLKAFIAGGALVGPLQDMDLHLDIGGRTVETVQFCSICRQQQGGITGPGPGIFRVATAGKIGYLRLGQG